MKLANTFQNVNGLLNIVNNLIHEDDREITICFSDYRSKRTLHVTTWDITGFTKLIKYEDMSIEDTIKFLENIINEVDK